MKKFDPWVSMFRLGTFLYHRNVFALILLWYSVTRHYVCRGHWHKYILQPGLAVQASAQSILLK